MNFEALNYFLLELAVKTESTNKKTQFYEVATAHHTDANLHDDPSPYPSTSLQQKYEYCPTMD